MNKQLTISNEQLTISNVSRRRVLPSSKASKQRHFSLLTSFLFLIYFASCDLFTGPKADLFKQISKEVDWANAPKLTVTVTFPPEWGNSPQSGDGKCGDTRKGYEFDVEFVPLSGYGFEKWLAFKTADYAGLDKTKSSNEVESSALNGNGVTITEGVSETGARTAKVTIDTLEPVTLVPWCGNRPRLSTQTNPPLNSIQAPFPFDQIVNIWFTMPVKASTIQDNIRVSAILLTDDERGQRGQYMNDNDGITEYFQLKYDADAKGLVDYVELSPKSTEQHPSAHLQLLSISVSVGPGIESEGGVAMAETQVINYQTDTSEAQKAYRPATIQAKRHDGDWFQDGDWNNPTKDRRFNYADDDYKTVQIRFTIPTANIPEGAPSVPNRITIIERLSYDLGGYNANGSIEIPYENVNPSGGYYTINHELQTRTSGIIRLLVLPWYEEDGEPLFQYLEVNNAMAQGQFVTVVMDNAPPGLTDIGAVIGGHVPPVNSGLHIFGKNSIMTLTLNRLSFLNDNGAQGGIPTSQAWNRPWTMDERKDLQWRVLVGNVFESDWLNVEENEIIKNVFTKDISALTVDTEYVVRVRFSDTMGNESTSETGLSIKRIEGEIYPVTNLRAVCNTTGNSITVSWTTPNDMLGAYVYVNGAEIIIDGTGTDKSHDFDVPVIETNGVTEGRAVSNVTRYDILVEAYSAAGRAEAETLSVWNFPDMRVSKANPALEIRSQADLNAIRTPTTNNPYYGLGSAKQYVLVNDITVTGHTPIGTGANPFSGKFYGAGRTITVRGDFTDAAYTGVFGSVSGAEIRDLTVHYAGVVTPGASATRTGGLAGNAEGGAKFTNIIVKGTSDAALKHDATGSTEKNYGGVVGYMDGTDTKLENVYGGLNLSLSTTFTAYIGGIAGYIKDSGANCITNCIFAEKTSLNITTGSNIYAGGIAGYISGGITEGKSLSACYSRGNLDFRNIKTLYAGGIIGCLKGKNNTERIRLENCVYEQGTIFVKDTSQITTWLGGVIGLVEINGYFKSCDSRALKIEVEIKNTDYIFLGGFAGEIRDYSECNECVNISPIIINNTTFSLAFYGYVGGFIGSMGENCSINECYSEGSISSKASPTDFTCFGGFAGSTYRGSISKCYATGNVNIVIKGGNEWILVGGFVGIGNASESWASGSLNIVFEHIPGNVYIGGFAGEGNLSNCYALVDVLVDNSRSTSSNGYVDMYVGGLVGQGGAEYCFAKGWVEVKSAINGSAFPIYAGGIVGKQDGAVRNCAALGHYVKTSGNINYANVGRIAGYGTSLNNNYADSGMVIGKAEKYGDVVPESTVSSSSTGITTINGADLTYNDFWTTTLGFSTSSWKFNNNYNVLTNVPKLKWED